MSMELKFSDEQMRNLEAVFSEFPQKARKAAAAAINKTANKAKTRIKRRVASAIGIGIKAVAARIRVIGAKESLVGIVRLFARGWPATQSSKPPQRGESMALSRDGEPQSLANTPFQQMMLNGHQGWMVRDGAKRIMAKGRYTGKRRQPIHQIYTDSPAGFLENSSSIAAEEVEAAANDLEKQLLSQIDRLLK
jgi:hypothetical protein